MKKRDLRVRVCQAELCNHVCAGDLPMENVRGSRSGTVDTPTLNDEGGRAGAKVGPVRAHIEMAAGDGDCLPPLPSEF